MGASTNPSATGGLGWSLGPYFLISSIGSGKFGTVYSATDQLTGREVALKLVPLDGAESDEKVEAERLGAMLQERFGQAHKGFVPEIFDHGPRASFYAIAMELVRGEQLRSIIARGPLSSRRVGEIGLQVCRFLEHAHQFETDIEGVHYSLIVHGDLKPDHVLFLPNGEVRVLDFGIAKALAERTAVTTNKWGSMPYASPERLVSDGHVNEHADFWSLGVMLYEMLTGFRPYRRIEHNPSRLNNAIIAHDPSEPLPADADPVLAAIVRKLLAPQIERRYVSAGAIARDIEGFLAGRETLAASEQARASEQTTRINPGAATTPLTSWRGHTPPPLPLPIVEPVPTEPLPRTAADMPPPIPKAGPPPLPPDAGDEDLDPWLRPKRRRKTPRRVAKLVTAAFLIMVVLSEGVALTRAQRMRAQIAAVEVSDIPAARRGYESIKAMSPFSIATARVGHAIVDRMVELADRVIREYRTENPVLAQVQWEQARASLALAAEIEDDDEAIESRREYVEGQLARITARDVEGVEAAIRHFQEAARLNRRSPDPYLGMARVYTYEMPDVEALHEALRQAEARGYKPGRREKAQLGDAYRLRAEQMRQTAARLRGDAKVQQLERARDDYAKCIEYFDGLRYFDSDNNLRTCRRRLAMVEAALEMPAVPFPFEFQPPVPPAIPEPRPGGPVRRAPSGQLPPSPPPGTPIPDPPVENPAPPKPPGNRPPDPHQPSAVIPPTASV